MFCYLKSTQKVFGTSSVLGPVLESSNSEGVRKSVERSLKGQELGCEWAVKVEMGRDEV